MISEMNDKELLSWLAIANADLALVSKNDPNSEWHEECFAATVLLAQEANKRGVKLE